MYDSLLSRFSHNDNEAISVSKTSNYCFSKTDSEHSLSAKSKAYPAKPDTNTEGMVTRCP